MAFLSHAQLTFATRESLLHLSAQNLLDHANRLCKLKLGILGTSYIPWSFLPFFLDVNQSRSMANHRF